MTAHLGAGLHVALHAPQPGVEGVPGGRGSNPRSDTVGAPDDGDDMMIRMMMIMMKGPT